MQNKITKSGKLLNKDGELIETGYSTSLIREYARQDIKANCFRIKEWDYYLITDGKCALALTIADNSYMSLTSASWLDFTDAKYKTSSRMKFFTFGKTGLPSTSEYGDVSSHNKKANFVFKNDGKERILKGKYIKFNEKGEDLEFEIKLTEMPQDSMVIVTPFKEDKKAFYYNQKINCMRAQGYAKIGDVTYSFDPKDSLATLDWGRGVWTYDNVWYWGSLSTRLKDGSTFGYNIGYGFGDTSAASENMLFYNGVASKLDQIKFNIPSKDKTQDNEDDYLSEWTFTSNDGRFEMRFVPILDRVDNIDLKVLLSHQHQVFGRLYGYAILDDGKKIELDGEVGFAEKVHNKW